MLVCPSLQAHLAQCDGAGGQADEAPFPAVGVLRQGKFLRQSLDHMLDLHRVVLGHELPNQPGERKEGGCRTSGIGRPLLLAPGPGAGRMEEDDLFESRNQASQGRLPSSAADGEAGAGSQLFPYSGSQFPFVYNGMSNNGTISILRN